MQKEAEKQIHDTVKEHADEMFHKDNQQSEWHFKETNRTVHLELFSDEGQLASGEGRSTESVVQVCPSQTLKIKVKIIHSSISYEQ